MNEQGLKFTSYAYDAYLHNYETVVGHQPFIEKYNQDDMQSVSRYLDKVYSDYLANPPLSPHSITNRGEMLIKRFHNPMTVPMLIIMSVAFISVTVVFLAVESLSLNFVYWIIIGMFILILPIIAIGERSFRKSDKKYSEEIGEEFNTAGTVSEFVKSSPKITLLTVLGVILFIAGLVALFMYNALIGGVVFATFLFSLLFIVLITSKKRNSVEEYIAVPIFGKARKYMQEIHNQILSLNPAIVSGIGTVFINSNIPVYAYIKNEPANEFYMLFAMDTILGGGCIRIYPCNPAVFSVFAERIKQYRSGGIELFMPTKEPFDYGLITDIVKFNIEQICMMPQIEHNGF